MNDNLTWNSLETKIQDYKVIAQVVINSINITLMMKTGVFCKLDSATRQINYVFHVVFLVKAFLQQAKEDFTKKWEEPAQVCEIFESKFILWIYVNLAYVQHCHLSQHAGIRYSGEHFCFTVYSSIFDLLFIKI